jgi:hypothetical protein
MRRALLALLLVCASAIASGCGLCGRPPVYPQAYVAPACDPCATGAVVARPVPAAVVVPAPGPPAPVVVH